MSILSNVLLITVDDLNYDSVGCFGCQVDDITPNIDKLASEGVRFNNSHVTIAVCQPSRSVLLTGRYPHHNGARGFEEIDASVTTLTQVLHREGFLNGIIGKEDHVAPRRNSSGTNMCRPTARRRAGAARRRCITTRSSSS